MSAERRNDTILGALRGRGNASAWVPAEPISQQMAPSLADDDPVAPFVTVACPDAGIPVLEVGTDTSLDEDGAVIRLRATDPDGTENFDLHALCLTAHQAELAADWLGDVIDQYGPKVEHDPGLDVPVDELAEIVGALSRLARRARAA